MFSGFGFIESAVLVYLGVLAVLACLIAWLTRHADSHPKPDNHQTHHIGKVRRR